MNCLTRRSWIICYTDRGETNNYIKLGNFQKVALKMHMSVGPYLNLILHCFVMVGYIFNLCICFIMNFKISWQRSRRKFIIKHKVICNCNAWLQWKWNWINFEAKPKLNTPKIFPQWQELSGIICTQLCCCFWKRI